MNGEVRGELLKTARNVKNKIDKSKGVEGLNVCNDVILASQKNGQHGKFEEWIGGFVIEMLG